MMAGRSGSACLTQSGTGVPAQIARLTSVPKRSANRRRGAVTWAYGPPIPACCMTFGWVPSKASYPAPRRSLVASLIRAWEIGWVGSRPARISPAVAPSGHGTPSAWAARWNLPRAPSSGIGSVRSTPIPALSISSAAAIPVRREISAFQASTSVRTRMTIFQPSPSGTISCSGSPSSIAPSPTRCFSRRAPRSASGSTDL